MFDKVIGVIGLLVSVLPLIVSSFGARRLRSLIERHSAALPIIPKGRLRDAYRAHIEDLAYELVARTALGGRGPVAVVLSALAAGFVLYSSLISFVAGAMAGGAPEDEARALALGSLGLATKSLVLITFLVGSANCVWAAQLSFSRALYLNVYRSDTQAFKRFIRRARVYVLVLAVPFLAYFVAYVFGVDSARAYAREGIDIDMGAGTAGVVGAFLVGSVFIGLSSFWCAYYFPTSSLLMKVPRLRTLQAQVVKAHYDSPLYSSGGQAEALARTIAFLEAVARPRVNLLSPPAPSPGRGQAPDG